MIITYLIGAGASAGALPVVEQISGALSNFIAELESDKLKLPEGEYFQIQNVEESKGLAQQDLISTLKWMKQGSDDHSSIDIFAKKLLITQQSIKFLKLKAGLTCFFIYLQQKYPVDKRYDAFLAALIDPRKSLSNLPWNLRIISWNYDYQFEKAYSAFTNENELGNIQTRLSIYPSDVLLGVESNNFSVYKLNGTTSVYDPDWRRIENIIPTHTSTSDVALVETLVRAYAVLTRSANKFKPLLTFAWETEPISEQVLKHAINATDRTEILVVIGYSFPFFNREIDRKIIGAMKNLKKVYFQAPDREAYNYIDRFQAIRSDYETLKLVPIVDVKQFFLPPEL